MGDGALALRVVAVRTAHEHCGEAEPAVVDEATPLESEAAVAEANARAAVHPRMRNRQVSQAALRRGVKVQEFDQLSVVLSRVHGAVDGQVLNADAPQPELQQVEGAPQFHVQD